jgi:zinc transport system permease protein
MRRMTLASDAIAHVGLPGIGMALLLGIQPLVGGLVMLLLGTVLVWAVETRTRIPVDTVIGVVFSASLAAGALVREGDTLLEALFGRATALGGAELAFGLAGSAAVTAFIIRQRHRLVIALVSPDLARTSNIDGARLSLLYLVTFSLTVALGLRYLGVLLMGSLVIIPAATAKHLAWNLRSMLALAVILAVVSTLAGTVLAHALGRETGPLVIATAAILFFLGLLVRRR